MGALLPSVKECRVCGWRSYGDSESCVDCGAGMVCSQCDEYPADCECNDERTTGEGA